jgi:hypothetical protein
MGLALAGVLAGMGLLALPAGLGLVWASAGRRDEATITFTEGAGGRIETTEVDEPEMAGLTS